jgi:hypothetical protein
MGRLVELWKTEETEARVVYSYGPSQQQSGRIACTKADGEVSLVEPVPKLSDRDDRFFYRDVAMAKLQMLHRSGEFPDKTYIAT